jgi:hypothetical protein
MGKKRQSHIGHIRPCPNVPRRHLIACSLSALLGILQTGSGRIVHASGLLLGRQRGSILRAMIPLSLKRCSCQRRIYEGREILEEAGIDGERGGTRTERDLERRDECGRADRTCQAGLSLWRHSI